MSYIEIKEEKKVTISINSDVVLTEELVRVLTQTLIDTVSLNKSENMDIKRLEYTLHL